MEVGGTFQCYDENGVLCEVETVGRWCYAGGGHWCGEQPNPDRCAWMDTACGDNKAETLFRLVEVEP